MLISDSLPQLWLSYLVLSLLVLATGYLGVGFLPRLPRWIVTGVVAGMLWSVAPFTSPLVEKGEHYSGLAPAVVVTAVGALQGDGGQLSVATPLLLVGMAMGGVLGALIYMWRRRRDSNGSSDDDAPRGGRGQRRATQTRGGARDDDVRRREPVLN
ncbi:hypothetical protein C8E00_101291 [Chromohalobacter marismortui]|uniref:Uncharacterized protein n=1 Tax=Chromohalobacter marismortui TaxID=42055 RepID=A0A4V3F4E4_9GAMM|nr:MULTISPECIES: hypothetical protein [Chromohalobacter]MCI0510518.1 hypothetical protein [Chromohalobacter sp.]MCI0594129.1 hypothetical protein [Chromohalobacter sp.]TDU24906.1 hypothetical protein C8E00_101291 [Chromohalobacter marismortui]